MEFINIVNKMEELKKSMEETPWSIILDSEEFYSLYDKLNNYLKIVKRKNK
jgi:hypothetical protein